MYSALTDAGLVGGVGTLKRKRHLRELVDNHNKDQHDDVLDATPHKKRAKLNNVRTVNHVCLNAYNGHYLTAGFSV